MKIESGDDAGHREALHQHALDEFAGGKIGERGVEGQHDGAVEARAGEQPQLLALVAQPEQRIVGTEIAARMRLERERRGRHRQRARAGDGLADHRAMAAMHAVEIADRDHRALERARVRRCRGRSRRTVSGRRPCGCAGRGCKRLPCRPAAAPKSSGQRPQAGFARPGTETTASPSSTILPSINASQCRRTLRPSATSSTTSTITVTTSPIFTGAWKFSVCER